MLHIEQYRRKYSRPYAVGRKNFLFHDTVKGARASSIIYSLVETAKLNNLNIYAYLETVLLYMPDYKNEPEGIEELMPWSDMIQQSCQIKTNIEVGAVCFNYSRTLSKSLAVYYLALTYYHSQNTLFQFLIALFSLNILQKIDNIYKKNFLRIFFKIIIIVFISILIYVCKIEYGILGFMMILSSYYFRQSLPKLVAALLACNFLYLDPLQAFGGLAILPIIFYKGKQTKKTGLWPYFYYPIHIIILYIILIIFGMNMNDQSISEQKTLQITDTLSENNDSIVFDQKPFYLLDNYH